MRLIGYMALHYGLEYMAYAIRSVIHEVDRFVILHSRQPSFGFRTDTHNPDNAGWLADMYSELRGLWGDKLEWHDVQASYEGQHRDFIKRLYGDDLIVRVDYDEIWNEGDVERMAECVLKWGAQRSRVRFVHYWRSFYWRVDDDPACPEVFWNPRGEGEYTNMDIAVHHFGYAIRPSLMQYKWGIHGHKNELRSPEWFTTRYLPMKTHDVHPTMTERWYPRPVSELEALPLPSFMADHPYVRLPMISDGDFGDWIRFIPET